MSHHNLDLHFGKPTCLFDCLTFRKVIWLLSNQWQVSKNLTHTHCHPRSTRIPCCHIPCVVCPPLSLQPALSCNDTSAHNITMPQTFLYSRKTKHTRAHMHTHALTDAGRDVNLPVWLNKSNAASWGYDESFVNSSIIYLECQAFSQQLLSNIWKARIIESNRCLL